MNWVGFASGVAEFKVKKIGNDIYLFLDGGANTIGPASEFGQCVIQCNKSNSELKGNWLPFIFHEKRNVWYRELSSLSLNDLQPYFSDLEVVHKPIASIEHSNEPSQKIAPSTIGERKGDDSGQLPSRTHATDPVTINPPRTEDLFGGNVGTQTHTNPGIDRAKTINGRSSQNDGRAGSTGRAADRRPSASWADESRNGDEGANADSGSATSTGELIVAELVPSEPNWVQPATANDDLTKSERLAFNLEALKVLSQNETQLTLQGKAALSRFSGWGGFADEIVRGDLLTQISPYVNNANIRSIKSSALYGYLTKHNLVKSIWNLLEKAGYKGGLAIEPSCGTGNFISNRIDRFDNEQHFVAVEIDEISAAITQQLHPSANVFNIPFEKFAEYKVADTKFDLAIGNIPFGENKILDKNGEGYAIHNYFLRRNMEMLRPGGVMAIISSSYTLDSRNAEMREWLHKEAQLLSVVRLPNKTFNGTSALSDLLVFRKRSVPSEDAEYNEIPFLNLTTIELKAKRAFTTLDGGKTLQVFKDDSYPVDINEAFTTNKHLAILAGEASTGLIGMGARPGLILDGEAQDAINAINEVSERIGTVFDNKNTLMESGLPVFDEQYNLDSEKPVLVGSLIERNKTIYMVESFSQTNDGQFLIRGSEYKTKIKDMENRYGKKINFNELASDYIALRDTTLELISEETGTKHNPEVAADLRAQLNLMYDLFVQRHGFINDSKVRKLLRRDALIGLTLSLEVWDQDKLTATKAGIFTESLARKLKELPENPTLVEAVSASFVKFGRVNEQFIEEITKKKIEHMVRDQRGVLYLNPANGKFEYHAEYLTGNVVEKLELAKRFAQSEPKYEENVKALTDVRPQMIASHNIGISFGARWLPEEIVKKYIYSVFKATGVNVSVKMSRGTESIAPSLKISHGDGSYASYQLTLNNTHGTSRCNFTDIINHLMTSTPIIIKTTLPGGESVLDKTATLDANNKAEFIKEDFERWCVTNKEIAEEVEGIYNEKVNVYNFKTSFKDLDYQFPDMSPMFQPRTHQVDFVINSIIRGNMLNADCVGAGKTAMQIMCAYEQKRLGLANLPTIIVPNHMLYQTAAEAQWIYPSAKICVITKEDLLGVNRAAFIGKLTMNQWDLAVITYGMFQGIQPDAEYMGNKISEEVNDLKTSLEIARKDGDRASSRSILLKLQKAEAQLEALLDASSDKKAMLDLGHTKIDFCLYDEYHKLKNLRLNMVASIPGISDSSSNIAFTEHIKMQYIMETYYNGEERGICAFTATPISNSISELYTIFRMLKPSLLKQEGIYTFNDWAAQYGEIVTALEVLPEGKGFQMKSRLSSFKNMPELLTAFRTFTQIHTREELQLPSPKYTEHTVSAEPNIWQEYIFDWLVERARVIRNRESGWEDDNFLWIVNDAAMASISHQAMLPKIDLPVLDTKLDLVVENCVTKYQESQETLGTQLIFCDKSVPTANQWNSYEYIKQRLIERGIPEDQIAFIHDASTDIQRFDLFAKVNAGAVRFLFGSTEKLGTGSNVQKRIVALHDVDIPWTPKELEQRLGRGVRQGNMHEHIDIFRYTTKGSFDVFRLETIKRKAVAISAALSDPAKAERRFNEETQIDYDTIIAETSDNQVIKEKANLDAKIAKLSRKRSNFYDNQIQLNVRLNESQQFIVQRTPRLQALEAANRRILEKIQSVDLKPAPENISEAEKKRHEVYGRFAQAQLITYGVINSYQDGDTCWIDPDAAKEVISILMNQSAYDHSVIPISAFGEAAAIRRVENTKEEGFKISYQDEIRYYDEKVTDSRGAFYLNEHYGGYLIRDSNIRHILYPGILNYPVSELLGEFSSLSNIMNEARDTIRAIGNVDLTAKFAEQSELDAAIKRRDELTVEIIQFLEQQEKDKEGKGYIDLMQTLEAYHEAGCPQDFNPYSYIVTEWELVDEEIKPIAGASPGMSA